MPFLENLFNIASSFKQFYYYYYSLGIFLKQQTPRTLFAALWAIRWNTARRNKGPVLLQRWGNKL